MRPTRYRALNDADLGKLLRRASFAEEFVERGLRRSLSGTTRDLEAIDELLALGLLTKSDSYAVQCLAVSLGVVLTRSLENVSWVVLGDVGHETFVLRHDESDDHWVSPWELLQRRMQGGEALSELFAEAVRKLSDKLSRADLLH